MNDAEIIKNPPDNATLWCVELKVYVVIFCKTNEQGDREFFPTEYDNGSWIPFVGDYFKYTFRSLDDIRELERFRNQTYSMNKALLELNNVIESLEQQLKNAKAEGVKEVADELNLIFADEHNHKKVSPTQFVWWNRVYGEIYKRINRLKKVTK